MAQTIRKLRWMLPCFGLLCLVVIQAVFFRDFYVGASGRVIALARHTTFKQTKLSSVSNYETDLQDALSSWSVVHSSLEYLSMRIQNSFVSVQYPSNCSEAKFFICDLDGSASGFTARYHQVIACHALAYSLGRILILRHAYNAGLDNFIIPLVNNKTCSRGDHEEVDIQSQELWNEHEKFNNAPPVFLLRYFHPGRRIGLFPPYIPGSVPRKIAEVLEEQRVDPALWYMGQSAYFLLGRLVPAFAEEIELLKQRMGITRPFVGLQIRHGDKVKEGPRQEAKCISSLEYMTPVKAFFDENYPDLKTRNVYIATDDPGALDVLKKNYTDKYRFITMPNVSVEAEITAHTNVYKASLLRGLMIDLTLLTQSDYVVCTLTSNVGRMVQEIRQAKFIDSKRLHDKLASMDRQWYFVTFGFTYLPPQLFVVARRDISAGYNHGDTHFAQMTKGTWYMADLVSESEHKPIVRLLSVIGYAWRKDIYIMPLRTELTDPQLDKEIDYLKQVI